MVLNVLDIFEANKEPGVLAVVDTDFGTDCQRLSIGISFHDSLAHSFDD